MAEVHLAVCEEPNVSGGDVTQHLVAFRRGDARAGEALFAMVYDQLHRMARRRVGGSPRTTLDTTALVHEAYLKLVRASDVRLNDRMHFFSVAARAMRQILVDHHRRRAAVKHGGGETPLALDEARIGVDGRPVEFLALDQALTRLAALDERLARVVELRFFAGLSHEEIGELLEIHERTVKRDWRKARAFLYRELLGDGPSEEPQ